MDREKILSKIRKCMALGRSPNEHEAAAALRQAQKLMELHGINEEDVGQVSFSGESVTSDYKHSSKTPYILMCVVSLIEQALGVSPVFGMDKGRHSVSYFGPRARAMLAAHAHTVVYRACGAAWREYLRDHPGIKKRPGARAGFYQGWCSAVREKIDKLVPTEEETNGMELAKRRRYGTDLVPAKTRTKKIFTGPEQAGLLAGAEFDIRQPVGQEQLRIGGNQ